jgi:hypothetical protein
VTEADWSEIDPLAVTNKPYLQQYQINTSSYAVGNDYQVMMTVDNRVGTAESDSVVFLLADVPG